MTEPKYQVNDMVEVSDTTGSLQFGGDFVLITEVSKIGDVWCYDFVIPERRGGVPEHLVARLVAHGIAPPKAKPGLGSGALREALEQIKLLVCGDKHPNWHHDESVWHSRNRIADICDTTLALSLSSPIEPRGEIYQIGFKALAAMIRCEYPDFDENHVSESLARITACPTSQEVREALCEALDCIGDNIDIPGTEWANRPMEQWMKDWRAAND